MLELAGFDDAKDKQLSGGITQLIVSTRGFRDIPRLSIDDVRR